MENSKKPKKTISLQAALAPSFRYKLREAALRSGKSLQEWLADALKAALEDEDDGK